MGESKRRRVKQKMVPKGAFEVAMDALAVYGNGLPWMIGERLSDCPLEDLVISVDSVGSWNHANALAKGLANAGAPFMHVRERARSGCQDITEMRAPAGCIWMQVAFDEAGVTAYEIAPVKPITVDGAIYGIVLRNSDFDEGQRLFLEHAARASRR